MSSSSSCFSLVTSSTTLPVSTVTLVHLGSWRVADTTYLGRLFSRSAHSPGSDEWFGLRWASRPGEWADRLNSLPKYVVSATLQDPKWTNVTVLTGNVVDEVTRLKQEIAGDIVVYASYQLGRTLIEHDLVDELRLFVFPVVVGDGGHLFGETSGTRPFRLIGSRTVGNGLAFLTYETVREALVGTDGARRTTSEAVT